MSRLHKGLAGDPRGRIGHLLRPEGVRAVSEEETEISHCHPLLLGCPCGGDGVCQVSYWWYNWARLVMICFK